MRRRELMLLLSGAIAAPGPLRAQERVRRIGVLIGGKPSAEVEKVWLQGLRERGYISGRNLHIEYRFTEGRAERGPVLAAELAALGPELIVAVSPAPAVAVRAAAPDIPMVFLNVADPIALGLVESLAHPGGNATGVATIVPEGFAGKSFQLLKELVPRASRVAQLINPENPIHRLFRQNNTNLAEQLGMVLITVEATRPDQFEAAFHAAVQRGAEAIAIAGDPLHGLHSPQIVALAASHRLPAIYFSRQGVLDGGLMSFGPDQLDRWRRIPAYVDKILKGERPADLPVEQPTRYEILVNLKTAKVLSLTIPASILAQADEVIE